MRIDTHAPPTSTEFDSALDPRLTDPPARPGWLRTHVPTLVALAGPLCRTSRSLLRDAASIVAGGLPLLGHRLQSSPVTLIIVAVNLALYLVVESRGGEKAVEKFFLD